MIENEQAFYDAYAFFFQLPFSFQKKNVLFTALMAGEPWGWRVIGITEAALESLAKHDFRYTPRLICRSHLVGRIETAKEIFTKKIPKEQFFRRFLETDVTVIALKSENTRGGPSKYIPIDLEQNLFPSRFVAFRHGPAERKYLRDLHAACRAGKVTPT
ncbi:MAG: hypothetical protein NTX64_12575, partial [Elusimicrobia bacterium]|nr:hypothetical protein [Elusimicrobiota bacterium]